MKIMRLGNVVAIAVIGTIVLSSCSANENSRTATQEISGELNGAGATSQGSASDAWIAAFQTEHPAVTINYSPDGSGAGRKAFISGGAAFAGSDSALSAEELAGNFVMCKPKTTPVDLPVYISPIALIFNIDGVKKLNLDSAAIAKVFRGDITKWNDPQIAALNPTATLPATPITEVHRSDDSGTTKNFTDYLAKTAPEAWDAKPSDTFPYQVGEAAQGTSGVVDAVTNGKNTIGYADASRAGSLGVAALKVGEQFVDFSAQAAALVVSGSPRVEGRGANDIAISLDRTTTDSSHYPLVLVSYLITCQEYADAKIGALVKAYAGYVASPAGQAKAAKSAGAAPLSKDLSTIVLTAIATIK